MLPFRMERGSLFSRGKLVGTFHYLDPKGQWIIPTGQDIAYPCPGVAANGPVIRRAVFRISRFGDNPPGSGTLDCTNP